MTYLASALFTGENSLGYEKGVMYKLIITGLKVRRRDGSGVCKYESMFALIKNWDIKRSKALDTYPKGIRNEIEAILIKGNPPREKVVTEQLDNLVADAKIKINRINSDYSQSLLGIFSSAAIGKPYLPNLEEAIRFPWSVGFRITDEQLDKDIAYLKDRLAREQNSIGLTSVVTTHGTFKVGDTVDHYLGGSKSVIHGFSTCHAQVKTSDGYLSSWRLDSLRKPIIREIQNEHGTFKVGDTVEHATTKTTGVILEFRDTIIPSAHIKISETESVFWNRENLRKPKPKVYRMLTAEEAMKAGRDYADRQEHFQLYQSEARRIAEGYSTGDSMVHEYNTHIRHPSKRKIHKMDLTSEPIPVVAHFGAPKFQKGDAVYHAVLGKGIFDRYTALGNEAFVSFEKDPDRQVKVLNISAANPDPKFKKGEKVKVLCNRANATIIQYETAINCSVKFDGMAGTFVFMESELGKIVEPVKVPEYDRLKAVLNSADVELLFEDTHIDWAKKTLDRFKNKIS